MAQRTFARRSYWAWKHHRDRAEKAGQRLHYTLEQLRGLLNAALHGNCPYCGRCLTTDNWSVDHRTPTSRGGNFEFDNLEVVCKGCNAAKGPLRAEEFTDLCQLLLSWPPPAARNLLARLKAGGRWAKKVA
jgi:5-methylcytosine-specific restriction endonuclease McrA